MRKGQLFWILLVSLLATACGQKEAPTEDDRGWAELKGKWEGVSGGLVENGEPLTVGWGEMMTTARWTGEVPEPPFELEFEAKRVDGSDFFCTVTFPVRKDEYVSLVAGGWGGAVVGISSMDGKDASENETT